MPERIFRVPITETRRMGAVSGGHCVHSRVARGVSGGCRIARAPHPKPTLDLDGLGDFEEESESLPHGREALADIEFEEFLNLREAWMGQEPLVEIVWHGGVRFSATEDGGDGGFEVEAEEVADVGVEGGRGALQSCGIVLEDVEGVLVDEVADDTSRGARDDGFHAREDGGRGEFGIVESEQSRDECDDVFAWIKNEREGAHFGVDERGSDMETAFGLGRVRECREIEDDLAHVDGGVDERSVLHEVGLESGHGKGDGALGDESAQGRSLGLWHKFEHGRVEDLNGAFGHGEELLDVEVEVLGGDLPDDGFVDESGCTWKTLDECALNGLCGGEAWGNDFELLLDARLEVEAI